MLKKVCVFEVHDNRQQIKLISACVKKGEKVIYAVSKMKREAVQKAFHKLCIIPFPDSICLSCDGGSPRKGSGHPGGCLPWSKPPSWVSLVLEVIVVVIFLESYALPLPTV